MKIRGFSTFWWFSVKSLDAERVLRHVIMVVGAGDSVGGCDSKKACDRALFLCPVRYGVIGVSDELAVVGVAGDWKMSLLGVS